MSWDMVKASDVIDIRDGTHDSPKYYNEGIPLITSKNINSGIIDFSTVSLISQEDHETFSKRSKVDKGDIILAMIGTIGNPVLVKVDTEFSIKNVALFKTSKSKDVLKEFLLAFLKSKICVRQLDKNARGGTQKFVSLTNLRDLLIPLPPLQEQQRIADILDKAEAINQKREQALALCDEFLRANFLDMFGEHFSSKGYPLSTKKSIALLTDYIDYRGKTPKKTEYGIPLITAKNVRKGYVDEEPREYISEDLYDEWMTRGLPLKNDVLFTTEAPLGNVALLGEYEKVAVGQRLVSLRCKKEVTPIYFMYALLNIYIQHLIFQRSSGSTVKGIRTKELYQVEIPIPPIELQQKFSEIVEKVNSVKARIQQAQELPLFDALSQKAFKGELTQ